MRVMIIGASSDHRKFGNKAVRAFLARRHEVLPVHPSEEPVEGLTTYKDAASPPGPIDVATLYVPPPVALRVLDQVAARGDVGEVWLNPGVDEPQVVARCKSLGLRCVTTCSILAIGESPAAYP